MFKSAATKIAHNSTLPALGGNQDLRPLQDLITAEKAVLISLQKLSVDYSKASEALRTWGLNEGDDLGDILSASTTILNHFSSALSQYASHGHVMRDQLKAIRTREEGLEDLKRRRRAVVRKADDAEKKLSKMSPEHKNLGMQTELLNRLRDEIRSMDSEIMTEDAALGDFKRTATRMWMGLKFGGLLECCEKGTVVAEFGKMIISEISEDITQPGLPRSMYYGHSKTENYVAEAHRCINDISLSTIPSVGLRDHRAYNQPQDSQQIPYQPQPEGYGPGPNPFSPLDSSKPLPLRMSADDYPQRSFSEGPGSPQVITGPSFSNQQQPYPSPLPRQTELSDSGYSQQLPPLNIGENLDQQSMDDFGVNTRSAGLPGTPNAGAGRFATFPVKTRPLGAPSGYTLQDTPLLGAREEDKSFSASIAEALEGSPEDRKPSSRWGGSSVGTEETAKARDGVRTPPAQQPWAGRNSIPPQYESLSGTSPAIPTINTPPSVTSFHNSLPPPPPGAALPDLSHQWASGNRGGLAQAASHTRNISDISGNDDALLAYMTSATVEEEPHEDGQHLETPEEEQQRLSRHVRFGEVQDVNKEIEKRDSLDKDKQTKEPTDNDVQPSTSSEPAPVQAAGEEQTGVLEEKAEAGDSISHSSSTDSTGKPKQHRVRPPTYSEEDEKALDAAAAREVSRELEALKINPPAPDMDKKSLTEPTADRGRLPEVVSTSYSEQPSQGSVAPLQPQAMSFAKRNVSPHPYAELNANAPAPYQGQYSPTNQSYGPSYPTSNSYTPSPAQAYAQSYQSSVAYSLPKTPDANIPPRFQALNQSMETQIPPRFQAARAHSPGSPTGNQLPPRFQMGASSQIPPNINLDSQDTSRLTSLQSLDTPYRTPPEYPRALGSNSSFTKSNISLNTPPVSGRTISAAAFKRPRNASMEHGSSGDPFTKKSLPSSPYPVRDPAPAASTAPAPPPAGAAAAARPKSEFEDDEYDYISAYVNSNPNSPQKAEFSGANDSGRPGGGYTDGRFATNLENGSLR